MVAPAAADAACSADSCDSCHIPGCSRRLWLNAPLPYRQTVPEMFHPLPIFVGLRYVRARTHKFFVSFITWVSLIGVCVGVVALIVILSVMNGLEGELRERLLTLTAHARIVERSGPGTPPARVDWVRIAQAVQRMPGVRGVAPYLEVQALAVRAPEMLPVVLRGIDPARERAISDLAGRLVQGRLDRLVAGSEGVIVGSVIAQQLGVMVGDTVTLLVPAIGPDEIPEPKLRELTVAGIFEVGLQDHDGVLLLAALEDVRSLAPTADGGLRVEYEDALAAPELSARVARDLPAGLEIRDWTQDHASYFRAIRIEKTMVGIILMLIVGVAAFNIVAMLVMVVTDKRADIAILRTLGASPRRVMGVFLTQGLVIGWIGVTLGIVLGVALALHVGEIAPWLERSFGFQIMDADVYYITRIPSDLRWQNVAWIGSSAFLLTALATIYPALRAAGVPPADALRYE